METKLERIIRTAAKFKDVRYAISYCQTACGPRVPVMGENQVFWCVTPREASTLVKAGYEIYRYNQFAARFGN